MGNIDKFLEIEKKYSLYDDEVLGVNYWNYIRFTLFNYDIMEKYLGLKHKASNERKVIISELLTMGWQYAKSVFSPIWGSDHKDVIFVVHPRRILMDGEYVSIYTDMLEDYIKNSVSIEIPKAYMHPKKVKTKNLLYLFEGLAFFWAKTLIRDTILRKKRNQLIEVLRSHMRVPFNEINTAYGIKLDLDYWAKDAAGRIFKAQYYRKAMGRILDKFSPSVVIEVVYYETYNMALNEEARKRGIPVIELQHGAMHSDHAAYQYARGVYLPQLPNIIFTFSDYWNKVSSLPESSTQMIATGFPYFEGMIHSIKDKVKREDDRITVLFISQETVGEFLAEFAVSTAKVLSSDKYRILYKLHPSENIGWKKHYSFLLAAEIEVIGKSELSIYELFAISDIQIGAYSTALYEGLGFGLKTYIYKVGHYDTMKPLVEQGYAEFIEDSEELALNLSNYRTENVQMEEFWKTNAQENICNEIERIGGLK